MSNQWWKTGVQAHQEQVKAEAEAEKRRSQSSRLFRFFMKPDTTKTITFVDGVLLQGHGMEAGCLDYFQYYEHGLKVAGRYENFVCLSNGGNDRCPLCEQNERSYFVGALTVIDHEGYTDKNGVAHPYERRLLVARGDTLKLLQHKAVKHGGLAGCTFEVMRLGEKSAGVGSSFEFVRKDDISQWQQWLAFQNTQTGQWDTKFKPADYQNDVPYASEHDLRKMGFGKPGIGGEAGVFEHNAPVIKGGMPFGGAPKQAFPVPQAMGTQSPAQNQKAPFKIPPTVGNPFQAKPPHQEQPADTQGFIPNKPQPTHVSQPQGGFQFGQQDNQAPPAMFSGGYQEDEGIPDYADQL